MNLLTRPHVELLENGNVKLLSPYSVQLCDLKIEVPVGFESDGASTPRLLWPLLPPWGKQTGAAVIHDYLCVMRRMPRRDMDALFLALLALSGVHPLRAFVFWFGVRFYWICLRPFERGARWAWKSLKRAWR